jgi:hypothetical protein
MHIDDSRSGRTGTAWPRLSLALALTALLWAGPSVAQPTPPASAPATAPAVEAMGARASDSPVTVVLAYADRIRGVPAAELAQEIARLADGGDSATRLVQLAIALGQSRTGGNGVRAQALLQRVLGQNDAEAQALHPLARLLAAQLTEARRSDEQAERQNQQLRDAQRRIDHLNDRLEALRAIERSVPSRPAGPASAPASVPAAGPR